MASSRPLAALCRLVLMAELVDSASGQTWPECQEKGVVIRNAGRAHFMNLQGFGITEGCFQNDCQYSDKFAASSIESCPRVCLSLPDCEFWMWGQEEGKHKCWFRLGDDGRQAGEGWVSGSRACHPPGIEAMVMGNSECWVDSFNYDTCCDSRFGPTGNAQCWDGMFNFNHCCLPKNEL